MTSPMAWRASEVMGTDRLAGGARDHCSVRSLVGRGSPPLLTGGRGPHGLRTHLAALLSPIFYYVHIHMTVQAHFSFRSQPPLCVVEVQ